MPLAELSILFFFKHKDYFDYPTLLAKRASNHSLNLSFTTTRPSLPKRSQPPQPLLTVMRGFNLYPKSLSLSREGT
jgi:hypothetical protein